MSEEDRDGKRIERAGKKSGKQEERETWKEGRKRTKKDRGTKIQDEVKRLESKGGREK